MSHSRVTLSKRLMQTFSNQNNLPRLPIPPLKESLNYYLQSVQAIQGNQESIQKTVANIDAFFPVGTKLRDLLSRYDKQQPNSWLERIWLDKAYNIWRVPIAINVNWWTQFQDVKSDSEDPQSNRAAALTHGLLQMNNLINKQLLPPEQTKNGQFMCMNQLKCVFQAYRTPLNPIDETRTIWPTTSDYIVVLVKNQIYKLPVHPSLSISDLKADFINILKYSIDKVQPHVGIFTAGDRGEWAKLYKDLSKNDTNKLSLATIKNALFAVALDDHTSDNKITALHHIFHNFGQNRWFDLGLTIVLDKNGRAGCNGEHSPCDAIVPANMFDYILKHEKTANVQPTQKTPNFKHLEFDFDDSASISKATENTRNYCSQIQVELLHFSDYGADFIKSSAKASPDAFVQLVLQLSYYKTHLQVEATYESASTRLFKHGRTETCRSASKEMVEFVSNFYDKPVINQVNVGNRTMVNGRKTITSPCTAT